MWSMRREICRLQLPGKPAGNTLKFTLVCHLNQVLFFLASSNQKTRNKKPTCCVRAQEYTGRTQPINTPLGSVALHPVHDTFDFSANDFSSSSPGTASSENGGEEPILFRPETIVLIRQKLRQHREFRARSKKRTTENPSVPR